VPHADPVKTIEGVLVADGTGAAVEVSRFENADAEAVRSAVTDDAIVQAVGRGRGVNRDASRPLDVWIMGNVVTPWPVADIHRWQDIALTSVMRMLARGVVLRSAADAHKAYPDLFSTPKAAEKAFDRAKDDFALIRERVGNRLTEVAYRPKGRGQQTRTAWCVEPRLPGLRGWVERIVGELSIYEVAEAGRADVEPKREMVVTRTGRETESTPRPQTERIGIDPAVMFPRRGFHLACPPVEHALLLPLGLTFHVCAPWRPWAGSEVATSGGLLTRTAG